MIENTLKEKIKTARKIRDTTAINILGVALGDIQNKSVKQDLTEEDKQDIIRKIVKSNNMVIDEITKTFLDDHDLTTIETLSKENEILESLIPKTMGLNDIKVIIGENCQILTDNFGKNMGMIMKMIKERNLKVDGSLVKAAVEEMMKTRV